MILERDVVLLLSKLCLPYISPIGFVVGHSADFGTKNARDITVKAQHALVITDLRSGGTTSSSPTGTGVVRGYRAVCAYGCIQTYVDTLRADTFTRVPYATGGCLGC